jgi:hypothetical protein
MVQAVGTNLFSQLLFRMASAGETGDVPMDWMTFKGYADLLMLEKDALHIYGAVTIQILAALLFRRSLASRLPWAVVLALELLNEGFDMWFGEEPHIARWQVMGAAHDLFNTMLLPTLLILLARRAPWLLVGRGQAGESSDH